MSSKTVRVSFNGETKTVALFNGLAPEELNDLLQAVFSFSGHVVGFQAEVPFNETTFQKTFATLLNLSIYFFLLLLHT
jgi:hypothetical protein